MGFRGEILGPLPPVSLGGVELHPGHSPLSFSRTPTTTGTRERSSLAGVRLGSCGTWVPVHQRPFPTWQDEKIQQREGKPTVDARYEAACNRLANKAVQRGSADNVTVMVVRIGL